MMKRALLVPLAALLCAPGAAVARPCGSRPVTVQLRCKAVLIGSSSPAKTLEAAAPKAQLSMQAVGKSATITLGDHWLSAELECSGRTDQEMDYALEVRLSKNGRPHASPIHLAVLRNLGLEERAGKPPLQVESYYFFEPSLPLDGGKYTRLDYTCTIEAQKG